MKRNGSLFRDDQKEVYMTLPELGVSVNKFSNVTLGKDEVDYMLINTKNISENGTISISDAKPPLKHIGSKKGVAKYAIKRGDIILPFRGRIKSIAVVIEDSAIPVVGHHGLMKISCGEDNMDLAFFIKDFLEMSRIGGGDTGSSISVDLLNSIKFPIASKKLPGYKDASINAKNMIQLLSHAPLSLKRIQVDILQNAIQQNNAANMAIAEEEIKFIKAFRNLERGYHMRLKLIRSKYNMEKA